MCSKKNLRLQLSTLMKIGIDPCNEDHMSQLFKKLWLSSFVAENNEGLESIIKGAKKQSTDVFHKYPFLIGKLISLGIMNQEQILEAPAIYDKEMLIQTEGIGCEVLKWLWRPVFLTSDNIRVGTALVEYSLVENIMLKVDDDIALIQRQCHPQELEVTKENLQKAGQINKQMILEGQTNIFQTLKYINKREFIIPTNTEEYIIEFVA